MGKGNCASVAYCVFLWEMKKILLCFWKITFWLVRTICSVRQKNYKLLKYLMGTRVLLNTRKKEKCQREEISDCIELSNTRRHFGHKQTNSFCMERSCKQSRRWVGESKEVETSSRCVKIQNCCWFICLSVHKRVFVICLLPLLVVLTL